MCHLPTERHIRVSSGVHRSMHDTEDRHTQTQVLYSTLLYRTYSVRTPTVARPPCTLQATQPPSWRAGEAAAEPSGGSGGWLRAACWLLFGPRCLPRVGRPVRTCVWCGDSSVGCLWVGLFCSVRRILALRVSVWHGTTGHRAGRGETEGRELWKGCRGEDGRLFETAASREALEMTCLSVCFAVATNMPGQSSPPQHVSRTVRTPPLQASPP